MQIYPFRALRYNTSKVALSDVVTQPYDKISPAMQQAYYEQSPYNLIRVILGKRARRIPETAIRQLIDRGTVPARDQ